MHRFDLGESNFSLFFGVGANHLSERTDSVRFEEHVFRTAETDTLSAESNRLSGVFGRIGVSTNFQRLVFICQIHDSAKISAVGIGGNRLNDSVVNLTGRTVERNLAAFFINFTCEGKLLVFFIHLYLAATGNTASAHSAGNNRRVRRLTAANGKDTLGKFHAFDIFGGRFQTNENDFLAFLAFFYCVLSRKYDGTCRRARRSRYTLADNVVFVCVFKVGYVKLRMQ